MIVAHVEYNDGAVTDEMNNLKEVIFRDKFVHFVWENERMTIPMHRVKSIFETPEGQSND